MRFIGKVEAKTDAKGRVFLPAAFRKILQAAGEEQLVLRRNVFQNCLVLHPDSVWNAKLDELRSRLNMWNGEHQRIFRQYVSEIECLTLDSNGRLLIPKRFMQMAQIDSVVRFVGMDETIELWNPQVMDADKMEQEELSNRIEGIFSPTPMPPLPI